MQRVLVLVGDAAEELDAMYPIFRMREAGYAADVAALTKRDVQLVIHDFDPQSDAYTEKNGRKLPVDVTFAEVDPSDYIGLIHPGRPGAGVHPHRPGRAPDHGVLLRARPAGRHGLPRPQVPAVYGLLRGRRTAAFGPLAGDMENAGATVVDAPDVVDGNMVSCRGLAGPPRVVARVRQRARARDRPGLSTGQMSAPGNRLAAPTAGAMSPGRIVDVAGRPVRVHEVGSGPAVILLHGSGPGTTAAAAWGPLAAALAGGRRVIAPDFFGFGASVGPTGRAAWTEQVLGVLEVLDVERFAVVGNSMGGAIALSLAVARPEAVTCVVGIGTLGIDMPLPDGLDDLWAYEPSRSAARALLELLMHDPASIACDAVDARLRATLEPGPRAAFAAMFPRPRERWVRDLALSEAELASIAVPVLLVHGAQDRVVPLRDSTLPLLGILRDVRAHVFGGVGHASPVERPAELHRLLTVFLEDHD